MEVITSIRFGLQSLNSNHKETHGLFAKLHIFPPRTITKAKVLNNPSRTFLKEHTA